MVGGAQNLPQLSGLTRHDRRFLVGKLIVVEVQSVLVGVQPLPSDRFNTSTSAGVRADPMCSISCDRLECTICTALPARSIQSPDVGQHSKLKNPD
jgi:hypothetical protein